MTQDSDGRIYDLRNGLGGYYRYGHGAWPRSRTRNFPPTRDRVKIAILKIHESVRPDQCRRALYAPVARWPMILIMTRGSYRRTT
jgi:hypothetical protein